MRRSTIIFGNGLGMSLDSDYFPISSGLASVWSGSEYFEAKHKELIKTAIPGLTEDTYPSTDGSIG